VDDGLGGALRGYAVLDPSSASAGQNRIARLEGGRGEGGRWRGADDGLGPLVECMCALRNAPNTFYGDEWPHDGSGRVETQDSKA
jgi:hypothetical protein